MGTATVRRLAQRRAETTIEYYDGCAKGVELWTVRGGVHAPPFGPTFNLALGTNFAAHPKP